MTQAMWKRSKREVVKASQAAVPTIPGKAIDDPNEEIGTLKGKISSDKSFEETNKGKLKEYLSLSLSECLCYTKWMPKEG